MPFPFESLDVYKRSLDFIDRTEEISTFLKGKISYSILDQMTRAALSVSLNIAEGNGRWYARDKMQFLRIARGSVFEIVPILQVLHRRKLIDDEFFDRCYTDLEIMAKMLTGFIKAIDK